MPTPRTQVAPSVGSRYLRRALRSHTVAKQRSLPLPTPYVYEPFRGKYVFNFFLRHRSKGNLGSC